MSLLCHCCSSPAKPRRATPGFRTCDRCVEDLREFLAEIPRRYAAFTTVAALLPQSGEEGRRGPGFGSRSPARDAVVALTDRRTTWTETDRLHHPPAVLAAWAGLIREEVSEQPPPPPVTIGDNATLISRRLDHATRQPWVRDLFVELREVRNQLRALSGERGPVKVGHCPNTLEDGIGCGAALYAPMVGDVIRCGVCHRQWLRPEWQHLGRTMGVVS